LLGYSGLVTSILIQTSIFLREKKANQKVLLNKLTDNPEAEPLLMPGFKFFSRWIKYHDLYDL